MKKTVSMALLLLAFVLMSAQNGEATSSYKKSVWASSLSGGVLKVQGPGYGSWGKNWVTVDSGVQQYREVGTSKGPVVVYQKSASQWSVVQLNFSTGAKQNKRNFSQPVGIVRGGAYGAIIQVGNQCYDYSWEKMVPAACR
nr:hypothetical protein [uncultured Desulfobulbus sp.]